MKQQILEIAQNQMKAGGYGNLNFAQIADALSTTRANLHHHFRHKQGLGIAATQSYISSSLEFIAALAQKNAGDFSGYITDIEGIVIASIERGGRQGGCICSQIIREEDVPFELLNLSHEFFMKKLEIMKTVIVESQERGTITKNVDSYQLATFASTIIMGMTQMALASDKPKEYAASMKGQMAKWVQQYKT